MISTEQAASSASRPAPLGAFEIASEKARHRIGLSLLPPPRREYSIASLRGGGASRPSSSKRSFSSGSTRALCSRMKVASPNRGFAAATSYSSRFARSAISSRIRAISVGSSTGLVK